MAACNPDCISIDQSVDILDGIKRIGKGFAVQVEWRAGQGGKQLSGYIDRDSILIIAGDWNAMKRHAGS